MQEPLPQTDLTLLCIIQSYLRTKRLNFLKNWSSNLPPLVPESDRVPDPALDRITDPFAVVPDPTSASGTKTNAPLTQAPVLTGTEGGGYNWQTPFS